MIPARFYDDFGLLTQYPSRDGGDSAHRFGTNVFCTEALNPENFEKHYYIYGLRAYKTGFGQYCRHPDKTKWYSNPNNFSRDQAVMLMNAMMIMQDKTSLFQFGLRMLLRFGFNQNVHIGTDITGKWYKDYKIPDPMTPAQVSTFIRGLGLWPLYPLLYLLDLGLFVDVRLSRLDDEKCIAKNGSRTDYHTMLCMDMIKPALKYDTFIAKFARRLYRKLDYKGAIAWVFRPESNCPPLAEDLIKVCERYIDAT